MSTTERSWQDDAAPRRMSMVRGAAVALAILFVGMGLVLFFQNVDDGATPGVGTDEVPTHPDELLVSWAPHGGEYFNENYKLFVVHAASGELQKLTPGPAEEDGVAEVYPAWSPDGQRVAFVREEGDQSDIYVMDAWPGSTPVNLTQSPYLDTAPVWSPDGSKILFNSSDGDRGTNIFVMDADGSNVQQLTSYSSGAVYPAWSPDGQQIAFARVRYDLDPATRSLQVWVMNADGSDPQPITDVEGIVGRPQWSPDGQLIAFHSISTIWTVEPDGSNLRNITASTGATSHPNWSAGGETVYVSGNFIDGTDGIAIANIHGEIQEQWSPEADILDAPVWSPDHQQIAFFAGIDQNQSSDAFHDLLWELRVANVDGSGERTLLTGSIDFRWPPVWRPVLSEEDAPPPAATPTPVVVATPTISEEKPPEAWITFEGQSQRGELAYACDWFNFPVCLENESLRFPGELLTVRQDASLTLTIGELSRESLAHLRAYASPLDDDQVLDLPGGNQVLVGSHPEEIPLEMWWSPSELTITADLEPGDYAVGVDVSLASDDDPPVNGSATYGFHIRVTDGPDPSTGIEINPFAPAFPDAEVVHVVQHTEWHEDSTDDDEITETWIDQSSGNVIVKRFWADGYTPASEPFMIDMRRGLRSITYSDSSLWINDLLSEDDPLLTWGTGELDRHRVQLQQGTTKVVGVEQFEGRTAVKVDLEAIYDRPVFVYLDPETLFPLGYLELGQQWRVISYETIETTTLSDMPVELFETNTTEMDYWHYHGQLSSEMAAGFVRYPVWGLGPTFRDLTLRSIDNYSGVNEGEWRTDAVVHAYTRDNRDVLVVTSHAPPADGGIPQIGSDREPLIINGTDGWYAITTETDEGNPPQLMRVFSTGYVIVAASDRETAIAAAEVLMQVNASMVSLD